MNAPPRLWTGEAVLDHALEVAGFKVEDLQRSMQVTREAMDAERDDGAPDHAIRLRASENVFGWVGLRGSRAVKDSQPVTVNGPTILIWDLSSKEIPPDSVVKALKTGSSAISSGSTSSSAIVDGERPPSESTGS